MCISPSKNSTYYIKSSLSIIPTNFDKYSHHDQRLSRRKSRIQLALSFNQQTARSHAVAIGNASGDLGSFFGVLAGELSFPIGVAKGQSKAKSIGVFVDGGFFDVFCKVCLRKSELIDDRYSQMLHQ